MADNLSSKSSKTLAGIVIAFRLFGYNEPQAIEAMQILSTRNDFDYQKYINEQVKSAPKTNQTQKTNVNTLFQSINIENIIENIMKANNSGQVK